MRWFLFPILTLILIGCDVPKAAPEKNPTLVIATDRVAEGDSVLFAEFGQKHQLEIVLKQVSTDSLIRLYQQDKYGLGIDIVLLHHAYDIRRVLNKGMLEPMTLGNFPEAACFTESKKFITSGIDPFICVSKKNVRANIYDDLNEFPFFFRLNHKSTVQFIAPYEERLHRAKTFEKIEKLHANILPTQSWYVDSSNAILTTYSDYKMKSPEDTLWNNYTEVHFPNSGTSGVFHDVLTCGVIQQSSHFKKATEFLEWLTTPEVNERFTANRGYEPIRETGEYRRFTTPAVDLLQYHTWIERMLSEIE